MLKRFCYEGTKIWHLKKTGKLPGINSRDIGKIFIKRHLYSVQDLTGKRTDVLEREFLQVMDSQIAELITEILAHLSQGFYPQLDLETEDFIRQFLYFQTKRSPDFQNLANPEEDLEDLYLESMASYEAKYGPVSQDKWNELLAAEKRRSVIQFARVQAIAHESPEIMSRLKQMSVHFAFPPTGRQFIIGSSPVVRFKNAENAVLGDRNIELWTPLTPGLLVGLAGRERGLPRFLALAQREVRKVNLEIYRLSSEVASANRRLLASVSNAR